MSRITSPAQGRTPIGYVTVDGRRLEVVLNDEFARFFEALAVRATASASQISNLQSAVDMSSVVGTGDDGGGSDAMPGLPGRDGATGATGPALGFLLADPELPDAIPGPQGPPGATGAAGPAIYLTQDAVDTETFFLIR